MGRETSDCAAAFDPSISHGRGADEQNRFLDGARQRGEVALMVATIGVPTDSLGRPTVRGHGTGLNQSIHVSGIETSITSTKLPIGSEPRLVADLPEAERDLGKRLLSRPPEGWWGLRLAGATLQPGAGGPAVTHEPEGTLVPILVDGLGVPVVAVWVSPEEDQRVYAVPYGTDPDTVLAWLVSQALSEYVPGALRRVRSPWLTDPSLQTTAESQARSALDELKARYAADLARLQGELDAATAEAEPIRYGLLYGTGATLEKATANVLRAAGFNVTDLDEELGRTASADLLVTYGTERRMIEVKAASGSASEKVADSLERHLSTWPELRPAEPINGPGVLVVNHQHRLHPDERTAEVFTRPEFVRALRVVVLSSRQLFDWWATADWEAIRAAVLGQTAPPSAANPATAGPTGRRWLFRK
ncbi:hypothetical protein [Actinomadura sp. 3N508]|uniref:hypothetical protein n=1 Tax=Actinomadura sp. 3N508 TaxID=3375153 RepID=UPI0037C12772